MKLELERVQRDVDVTIGSLTIDGVWQCWIVEDAVREVPGQPVEAWKIKGQTAIPRGVYSIVINRSARFQRDLPLLLDVPGFEGIRIHPGNTHADTEGCLLPGEIRLAKSVGRSQAAFGALFAALRDAIARGASPTIEIR